MLRRQEDALKAEAAAGERAAARRQRDVRRKLANLEARKRALKDSMRGGGWFG